MYPNRRNRESFSDDYKHFNNLIWQVPSWGIAITGGILYASYQINVEESDIPIRFIRSVMILIGSILLFSLSIALFKYRLYQAYSMPISLPKPPIGVFPQANILLQFALNMLFGSLLGIGLYEATTEWYFFPIGPIFAILNSLIIEDYHKFCVEIINKERDMKYKKKQRENKLSIFKLWFNRNIWYIDKEKSGPSG